MNISAGRPDALVSPASFWVTDWIPPLTAWAEHAPFAFWLVDAIRPRTLVELGCHWGYSYMAFCQAVLHLQLDCDCFAVDTWKGDEDTGQYDDEVFRSVNAQNGALYAPFSKLIRSTFDQAAASFPNGSIDLLHIDGSHNYEAVKNDFECWLPKMSASGVVLFHDTNVRERDFGVWRLWQELAPQYPHFEFLHGHGLGVLVVGRNVPARLASLVAISAGSEMESQIRAVYSLLGGFQHFFLETSDAKESEIAKNLYLQLMTETGRHELTSDQLVWLIRKYQRRHAELNEMRVTGIGQRKSLSLLEKRLLRLDEMLASYCEKSKNPFKLLFSRLLEPGMIRTQRKTMQKELKEITEGIRKLRKPPVQN